MREFDDTPVNDSQPDPIQSSEPDYTPPAGTPEPDNAGSAPAAPGSSATIQT